MEKQIDRYISRMDCQMVRQTNIVRSICGEWIDERRDKGMDFIYFWMDSMTPANVLQYRSIGELEISAPNRLPLNLCILFKVITSQQQNFLSNMRQFQNGFPQFLRKQSQRYCFLMNRADFIVVSERINQIISAKTILSTQFPIKSYTNSHLSRQHFATHYFLTYEVYVTRCKFNHSQINSLDYA